MYQQQMYRRDEDRTRIDQKIYHLLNLHSGYVMSKWILRAVNSDIVRIDETVSVA